MRELDFVNWIQSQSNFDGTEVPLGPGDDMALVMCGREEILVTTDQVLDGVHFRLAEHGPAAAGRKAMARSLSDAAAMAVLPVAAVATTTLPKGFARADAEAVYHGLRLIGDQFSCPLVGGDVASWDGALTITTTVLARPLDTKAILRSGAIAGDAICVTGQFGGAWRSNRHLVFVPRIAEAIALARSYELHALIDVSDGLSADLAHICRTSGVGAVVRAGDVPIHQDAKTYCPDAPLAAALDDGEDYELLFAMPSDQAEKLVADQGLPVAVSRIGTITPGDDITLEHADGRTETLLGRGWEHAT
ncbi:MAG: thiamine-phosphate kinase [Planctomycetes bacterium]|nr:thiamine-phosphate kinase [Planctomycetota bacterium]